MTELALLLFIAAIGFGLANWLKLPVIPLLILPGALLSLAGMRMELDFIGNALELGLTFLVFASGIELNPKRIGRNYKAVVWVGLVQFVVAGLAGFGMALLLGFGGERALYIAFALSTSSTLVVLRHLKQRQQMFEPFGRVVTGVLLLQDVLMIVIIIVLTRVPQGWQEVGFGLAGGGALFGLAILAQRRLMPLLIDRMKLDEESLLLSILALLFAFVGLTFQMGLPPIVGAFLAGFALASFPVNGVVRGLLSSLTDFFLAIFFTALGAVLVFPDLPVLLQALLLSVLVVVLTPPLVTMVAEFTGLSSRSAIESGLLLAQTSEFSLVLGFALMDQITPEVFSIIALVMVFTMVLTPFLATDKVARKLLHLHPMRRRLKASGAKRDHVLLLGFGAGGMWMLKPLQAEGYDLLVVDDDPIIMEQLTKMEIPSIRGDASDEKILEQAGARHARLIVAALRRVADAENVLRYVQDIPVLVRVFESKDAERIRELGGIPILNSSAAAETFMGWFEKGFKGRGVENRAP
jgi:Kef-type K+ transport system membrane component KefB